MLIHRSLHPLVETIHELRKEEASSSSVTKQDINQYHARLIAHMQHYMANHSENECIDYLETEIEKILNEPYHVQKDVDYLKSLLPKSYSVDKTGNGFRCISKIGIKQGIDAEDDEHWGYIVSAIKAHFGKRFLEINHTTNFCHTDFTIFLKKKCIT